MTDNNIINSQLNISCKIWDKEVYELVDYYNTNNTKTKLKINSSGVLYREDKFVIFAPGENQEKSEGELLRIKKDKETGKYSVDCGTWSKELNKLIDEDGAYIVYRGISFKNITEDSSNRYYKLSQGDIIKIGRIYFKVLDIHLENNLDKNIGIKINGNESTFKGSVNQNSVVINGQQIIRGVLKKNGDNKICFSGGEKHIKNSFFKTENAKGDYSKFSENKGIFNPKQNQNSELFALTKRPQKKEKIKEKKIPRISINSNIKDNPNQQNQKQTKICRICYGDDSTEENPLIYPCICKGSMKYIHYDCLKNWLNSKIEEDISVDSDNNEIEVISYNRKEIACELCKEKLPDYIKYNNRYYNISFYKPKFKEFIVLESMRADKHRAKFIHLMSFDNKDSIHIGRSNDCELSIAELSVSRFHCILRKDDGNIYLEDNTSKFGTLVLVQNNNLIINDSLPLNLQINKTFIKIKVPRIESCSLFCCKEPPAIEQSKLNYQMQNKKCLDILSYIIIKENVENPKEEEESIDGKNNLIDENNNEKIDANIKIDEEKDLIDKDDNENNTNKNEEIIDNQDINSENILLNSANIKRISIKNDENDINKNNLSADVNGVINFPKENEINNESGKGRNKTINLIKIKNQPIDSKAYDKTNSNPMTTNNHPNIYNPNSEKEEIIKEE